MISTCSALRSTSLIISATLLSIAAEPLPTAVPLTGVKPTSTGNVANVSYGDVDGDGFVDLAIGNIIYWGSASGWKSSTKLATNFGSLWIVPNVTGAGLDGKVRPDLVAYDSSAGTNSLIQVLASTTKSTLNTSSSKLTLTGLSGAPAVGDFGGDAKLDIAWIDTGANMLQLSVNTTGSFTTASSPSLSNGSYAAVAGVDWEGTGTGKLDLLMVSQSIANGRPTVQLFAHGQSLSIAPAFSIELDTSAYSGIFHPDITIGDINGDGKIDALVTTHDSNTGPTYVIMSTGVLATAPSTSFNKFKSGSQGWIVPDVTGDGIDDVAVYSTSAPVGGGIVHGGSDISTVLGNLSGIAIDRTIPIDGQANPLYAFGGSPYGSLLRPTVVSYAVNATPWDRHLVLVDAAGYLSSSTTLALPTLSPTIIATVQDLSGSGALAIVDSLVTIDFPTTNGSITGLVVSVSNAVAGDVLSDAVAVPATITAIDLPLSNGSLTRTYGGTMTVAQATSVLKNVRFTAAQGGAVRSAFVVLLGQADASGTGPRAESYVSAKFQTATLTPPGLAFTAITGAKVGGTVISEVRGGNGTYTVTVDGGVGFAGGSPDNVRAVSGPATNVYITPTRSGKIKVTVTDSAGLSGSFTFTATDLPTALEPAPLVTTSIGAVTVFGAICPGTFGGVQSLRTAFGSADNRRARGFTWDSTSQTYHELPAEPTGGLLPTDGVFLATRVDLGLDFSGPAMPPGSTIVLRAGWNFVGLGPVQLTSASVVRTHSLADDFTLTNLSGGTLPLSQITAAYLWDGSTYSTTTVLQSGIGYWIRNVSSPAVAIILTRKDSDFDGRAVRTAGASTFASDAGAPPTPPANGAQASNGPDAESGGCGAGSGIAIALAGMMAFLRLGLRRVK